MSFLRLFHPAVVLKEEKTTLRIVPKARMTVTDNKNTLVGSHDKLSITFYAVCTTVVEPYEHVPGVDTPQLPLPGLVITRSKCQNNRYSFNIGADAVAFPITRTLRFKLSYGELYEEYLPFTFVIRPATATPRQVRNEAQPASASQPVSGEQRRIRVDDALPDVTLGTTHVFVYSKPCINSRLKLALGKGETARLKQRGHTLPEEFNPITGEFKYCSVQPGNKDGFLVEIVSSDGQRKRVIHAALYTMVNQQKDDTSRKTRRQAPPEQIIRTEQRSPEKETAKKLLFANACVKALHSREGDKDIGAVFILPCVPSSHQAQHWFYNSLTGLISNQQYSGYCLTKAASTDFVDQNDIARSSPVVITRCDATEPTQRWHWDSQRQTISLLAHPEIFLTKVSATNLMAISDADFKRYGFNAAARRCTLEE